MYFVVVNSGWRLHLAHAPLQHLAVVGARAPLPTPSLWRLAGSSRIQSALLSGGSRGRMLVVFWHGALSDNSRATAVDESRVAAAAEWGGGSRWIAVDGGGFSSSRSRHLAHRGSIYHEASGGQDLGSTEAAGADGNGGAKVFQAGHAGCLSPLF